MHVWYSPAYLFISRPGNPRWHSAACLRTPIVARPPVLTLSYIHTLPRDHSYTAVGGLRTEWVLLDPDGNDRFGHKGDTVIPSSGAPAWSHVHRPDFGRIKLDEEVHPLVCCC